VRVPTMEHPVPPLRNTSLQSCDIHTYRQTDRQTDRLEHEDNLKTDLMETRLEGVNWIHLAHNRGQM
jgi:hypothetical protein